MLTYLWRVVVSMGLVLALGVGGPRPAQPQGTVHTRSVSQPKTSAEAKFLQLSAAGHLVGFAPTGWHLTNGQYALAVTFMAAKPVVPQAAGGGAAPAAKAQAALTQVTYPNLWPGVTLAYAADAAGIMRSTYTLATHTDVSTLRLRYNVPVAQAEDGGLRLSFAAGIMEESAPIAWQEVNGQRQAVAVRFVVKDAQEVGFALGAYNPALPVVIDPLLKWNTFLGGTSYDYGYSMTVDGSGNTYVVGESSATWGTPVTAFAGGSDGFVAKLNANGALLWNTFVGGTSSDTAYGVDLDSSGNLYVSGISYATWGTPLRPYSGSSDTFVVRLSAVDGVRSWNTFLGGTGSDEALWGLDTDSSGNVYVGGDSSAVWGSPVVTHSVGSNYDAFVARLTSTGALNWNTFIGITTTEYVYDLATDNTYVYITGYANGTWGTPVRAFGGVADAFVARFTASNGAYGWHTFLGGTGYDNGLGLTLGGGALYVSGYGSATWGTPVRAYSPIGYDAFVARLTTAGALVWNTFLGGGTPAVVNAPTSPAVIGPAASGIDLYKQMLVSPEGGSSADDYGYGLALDATNNNLYVAGGSYAKWGLPARPFAGGSDGFVVRLNSSTGQWAWQTFLGGTSSDWALGVGTVGTTTVYAMGYSFATWGGPIRPFSGNYDTYVARLNANYENFIPMPIRAMTMGLPISQSFVSGVVPPAGWSLVSNNSSTWQIASGQGYNDSFAAKVVAASGQDEVLLSPFLFTSSSANVSFYSRGNAACIGSTACDLKVWMVVGGWASGTKTLLATADEAWPGEFVWTQTTVSAPTNFQTAQIAFEFVNSGVANVYLDDISITMGP